MELHILEHSLKVASIEKEGIQICTHGLVKLAFLSSRTRCKFFSLTETPEDYTLIVDEEGFKELPQSEHISVADATWVALNVVSGGGNASNSQPIGVTKIAKSVIAPLADHNISVFMLSTYQTDFILVRERDLPMVMHTLSAEFTLLRVVNGETVAAPHLGATNGFVKPKLAPRPVIHPLSSPSNMFCVTSLDPDTLPSVATLLMDVMFYSAGSKEASASSEDSGHIRFFSFSLIEGYVSLVMDEQTTQRFPNNVLFTSASGELWKMVRIGGQPLGFGQYFSFISPTKCPNSPYQSVTRVPRVPRVPRAPRVPRVPRAALQTSAASWLRYRSRWPRPTFRRTTSAPSSSTTLWFPRRTSRASSRLCGPRARPSEGSRRLLLLLLVAPETGQETGGL